MSNLDESPEMAPAALTMAARDQRFMRIAIERAQAAPDHGDVPIGAVVVADDDSVLAAAENERELRNDPTAHAELIALRAAAAKLGTWRVHDATLYVTLEPCAMCAGAIILARIPRVVWATADPKAGACGSTVSLLDDPRFNHRPAVTNGVLAGESAALLKEFFAARRGG